MGRALDWLRRSHGSIGAALDAKPWRQWLVVYAALLLFFVAYRCVGLSAMLRKYASSWERTAATKAKAFVFGISQDIALTTLLLVALSIVDSVVGPRGVWVMLADWLPRRYGPGEQAREIQLTEGGTGSSAKRERKSNACLWFFVVALRRLARFAAHALAIVFAVAVFAADMLLLRIRGMRFTFEYIAMYLREKQFASGFAVDPREVAQAKQTVAIAVAVALVLLGVTLTYCDFTRWHLGLLVECRRKATAKQHDDGRLLVEQEPMTGKEAGTPREAVYCGLECGAPTSSSHTTTPSGHLGAIPSTSETIDSNENPSKRDRLRAKNKPVFAVLKRIRWRRVLLAIAVPAVTCSAMGTLLLVVSHSVPAVVSATALNDSLNELFRVAFHRQFLKGLGDGTIGAASLYIDSTTESYELFQDDVLFRKTTGFKGPLAFDVAVNASDPPNVLVLVVESFRYQDSLYIVGNQSQALLKRQKNITLTPQFDRWAKRGVTFRNFWSSWPTSRSIESILFGQVPYDHVTSTGTTSGRTNVKLSGMPQLFKAKGYETVFTSGAKIQYDQWDQFLPAHGFEEVSTYPEFYQWAMDTKNVTEADWHIGRRLFGWGVHDDLSLELLGDLMVNKTRAQKERVQRGEKKTPFFVNHYTISSHTPFKSVPAWFTLSNLTFLEPVYKEEANADDLMRYAQLRYFADMAIGSFLDAMQAKGVLNDTIVVITGDHGQSPEITPEVDQIAATRVAATLIAEGRLGEHAGKIVDDTAEHYDLLNTLADITGVPDGGFLQSGVGRSLRRAFPPGERTVWANNPQLTLAAVKGHRRLRFDREFSMMGLFDVEEDPYETDDLMEQTTASEREEWETLRERGRRLSRYFRVRWDNACITQVRCS